MMAPFPVRIGLDEIATETQKCEGFTFFCLPEVHVAEFTATSQRILKTAGLKGFHANQFDSKKDGPAYKEFLELGFEFMRRFPQSFAACRLFSAGARADLMARCDQTVEGAIEEALGKKHPSVPILKPYFMPLVSLAGLSRNLAPDVVMHVEMDSHTSLKDLSESVHEVLGTQIPPSLLLKGMYNGYAKRLAPPRPPMLPDDGVVVLDDEASIMVQAADVVGNFAVAHMFVRLGKTTAGRVAKATILETVAGNDINAFDPTGKVTVVGNDLVLVEEGAITLRAAWETK